MKALLTVAHLDGLCVLVLAVKKEHPNRRVHAGDGERFVQAPPGMHKDGVCWKPRRWLYSMRPAAHSDDFVIAGPRAHVQH